MAEREELCIEGPPSELSDFTFYREEVDDWEEKDGGDALVRIESTGEPLSGRALLCRTDGGHVSITVRKLEDKKDDKGYRQETAAEKWKKFGPFSLDTLCCEYQELLGLTSSDEPAQGLLLITGSTNSSKTLVAQGLIHKYIEARQSAGGHQRRLHLVTCEDPVEATYQKTTAEAVKEHGTSGFWPDKIKNGKKIDYTPRVRGTGSGKVTLRQALNDALRQTPTVFYAGEVRNELQLRLALDFARTGHFIVATAHAGSLSEAFQRLLDASKATTPARRGQVVQRIFGVIHQQRFPVAPLEGPNSGKKKAKKKKGKDKPRGAIIPTLWRRTPMGIASMVSEGLSSIMPNNPRNAAKSSVPPRHVFSFGRLWFAKRLLAVARNENSERAAILPRKERDKVIRESGLSDLNGI